MRRTIELLSCAITIIIFIILDLIMIAINFTPETLANPLVTLLIVLIMGGIIIVIALFLIYRRRQKTKIRL
jgi:hypothetical protein